MVESYKSEFYSFRKCTWEYRWLRNGQDWVLESMSKAVSLSWFLLNFFTCSPGLVDSAPWHSHTDGRCLHVHIGPALPGHVSQGHGWLDAANQVGTKTGCRHVRMPDIDATRSQFFRAPERCRWVIAKWRNGLAIWVVLWCDATLTLAF